MRFVPVLTGPRSQVHVNLDFVVSVSSVESSGTGTPLPFRFTVCTADGKSYACLYATEHDATLAMQSLMNPPKSEAEPL